MALIIAVVFLGVFIVLTMVLFATGAVDTKQTKQTLENLESALKSIQVTTREHAVDIRKTDLMSAVPWINRWLLKIELTPKVRTLLLQADLKWTAGRLLLMSATFFMIPAIVMYVKQAPLVFIVMIGALLGVAPVFYVLQRRKKRFEKFEQGLPEALDLMVSALRAGQSLVSALRLVAHESPAPISGEFRICFEEQNYGLDLRNALENLVNRVPLQDLRIVSTAILVHRESGGNLAEVLDKASALIRDRFRLKRQVRVHTAQGRLTGLVLTILPMVLGIALYCINPDTMSLLWKDPLGLKVLYTSAAMTVAGGLFIRKIVNMEV